MSAVSDHVSVPDLVTITQAAQVVDILDQQGIDVEQLRAHLPSTQSSKLSQMTLDSRPELLIDQSLIPDHLDLDMEMIEDHEEAEEGETNDLLDETDAVDTNPTPDSSTFSKMEKNFLSATSKLRPGESIDLVTLEMQSKGLNVEHARAELIHQAIGAQKLQHEMNELEKAQEAKLEQLKQQVDQDEAAPTYDPTMEKIETDVAPPAAADVALPSTPPAPSVFSALIPHFDYSLQGFFRQANPSEPCAFCAKGELKHV